MKLEHTLFVPLLKIKVGHHLILPVQRRCHQPQCDVADLTWFWAFRNMGQILSTPMKSLRFSATLKASQSFEDNWGRAEYSICKMAWCSINSNSDAEHKSEVIYYFINIPIVTHGYWTCSYQEETQWQTRIMPGMLCLSAGLKNLTLHLEMQEVVVWEESWPFLLRLLSSDLNQ